MSKRNGKNTTMVIDEIQPVVPQAAAIGYAMNYTEKVGEDKANRSAGTAQVGPLSRKALSELVQNGNELVARISEPAIADTILLAIDSYAHVDAGVDSETLGAFFARYESANSEQQTAFVSALYLAHERNGNGTFAPIAGTARQQVIAAVWANRPELLAIGEKEKDSKAGKRYTYFLAQHKAAEKRIAAEKQAAAIKAAVESGHAAPLPEKDEEKPQLPRTAADVCLALYNALSPEHLIKVLAARNAALPESDRVSGETLQSLAAEAATARRNDLLASFAEIGFDAKWLNKVTEAAVAGKTTMRKQ